MLNLIKEQDDNDKIYSHTKNLIEPHYEFLTKKREDTGIKHLNNSNAFIKCSNTMNDIYENVDDYNINRRRKILIIFDDMIADIMAKKNFKLLWKKYLLDAEN